MIDYEKLGVFYLGKRVDTERGSRAQANIGNYYKSDGYCDQTGGRQQQGDP
jgi:hypothetical protein